MTWKTHMMGGALTGALFLENISTPFPNTQSIILMSAAAIAALLPDVDEKESKAGKALPLISHSMAATNRVLRIRAHFAKGRKKRELYEKARNVGHRGILHYLITWIILTAIFISIYGASLFLAGEVYPSFILAACAGASIGYLSHLLLDMISGRIALLYPLCKRKIGIKLIPQGGFIENIMVRGLLLYGLIVTIM